MPMDLIGISEDSIVRIEPDQRLSAEEFFRFCQANSPWHIERMADGEIIIMPPAGGESGDCNAEIIFQLRGWAKRDGRGKSFDSNTGFQLPNGAIRSPDAAWVGKERWAHLSAAQRKVFVPLCPEFVIELVSPSDSLPSLKGKMREWIDNGAELGWLIDPDTRTFYIYRSHGNAEERGNSDHIVGEGSVNGFVLDLTEIWSEL